METIEIYNTLTLIRGDKIEILIARGINISIAFAAHWKYNYESKGIKLDPVPFLMSELCLVNGVKRNKEYYLELISDDYRAIADCISDVLDK